MRRISLTIKDAFHAADTTEREEQTPEVYHQDVIRTSLNVQKLPGSSSNSCKLKRMRPKPETHP